MFKNNFVGAQAPTTLTATHPALPELATLRLRQENGSTDRANPEYGNVTIAHSATKEFGGGFRHVLRNNLREQGDIAPASSHVVITNRDTLVGEARAAQSVYGLIGLLATLHEDIEITNADADGLPLDFSIAGVGSKNWDEVLTSSQFKEGIQRLVGRES